MNPRNDYIRDFLGVTEWHKAGYTGSRGLTASGEDFINGSSHAKKTLEVFHEFAPDREVVYVPFGADKLSEFDTALASRPELDTMFYSRSLYTSVNSSTINSIDAVLEKYTDRFAFFNSVGNEAHNEFSQYTKAKHIYGVGAVTVLSSGAFPVGDSSESEFLDYCAPIPIYIPSQIPPYGGTSTAGPVLVAQAALVQDFFRDKTGRPLSEAALIKFLFDHRVDMEAEGHDEKTGWGYVVLPPPETVDILRYTEKTITVFEPAYEWLYSLSYREKTDMLVLHHAAIPTATAEQIHAYHQNANAWNGIAYHYYVRKNGDIYRGRPEDAIGGHTLNYNETSIGVCFEGDFNNEEMSEAQVASGIALLADIRKRYPDIKIYKHKDLNATSCPGNNFRFEEVVYSMTYADFKVYMQRYEMEKTCEPVSEWARETWELAKDKGIFDGTMPKAPFTREQGAAVMDRLGLIK